MGKMKIKTGDHIKVIAGNHKGSEGKVIEVDPNNKKVKVEGVNMISKSMKPSSTNPQGGIVKKEAFLHVSNVSLLDPKSSKPTRVGFKVEDGKKVRYSKKSNQVL